MVNYRSVFAVVILFGVVAECVPVTSQHVVDPVMESEFRGVGGLRVKREGGGSEVVGGGRKGGWRRRRRGGGESERGNEYVSVGKLDSSHPFRRKVRPVEKPITPYFVRILRRRPVGPSAMNYTNGNDTFQNSDNGEVIDVPRVLVDKRRNKNVDIHPIYVVEDESGETQSSSEIDYPTSGFNESLVFVPTKGTTGAVSSITTPEPLATGSLDVSKITKESEVIIKPTSTPSPPIVRFTRVEETEERVGGDYYSDYKRGNGSVDYLPLEYDYEKVEGDGAAKEQRVIGVSGDHVAEPLRLISLRDDGEGERGDETNVPAPSTQPQIYETVDNHHLSVPSRKRVLQRHEGPVDTQEHGDLSASSNAAVYGDYGYGGVVIGDDRGGSSTTEEPTSTTTTSTTTTTPAPTTTTRVTTTTTPTTTTTTPTTTTTTTTTTTPRPTTTTTTTTTTTPPPTTTTTTTTTTPPPPPPPISTTPLPSPLYTEEQLLTEILNNLPDDNTQITPEHATTLQQLLLTHLLTSTPPTPHDDQLPQFTQPHVYTNPPDLQTSASTTTALFSTRADTTPDSPRTTTTRNPILLLFDNLTGNSNQQRSTIAQQPQQQVVSIVRPITSEENKGRDDGAGNFMRMLIQLPGNLIQGIIRAMQTISQMGINMVSGVMKFIGNLSSGSSSSGGLFGG